MLGTFVCICCNPHNNPMWYSALYIFFKIGNLNWKQIDKISIGREQANGRNDIAKHFLKTYKGMLVWLLLLFQSRLIYKKKALGQFWIHSLLFNSYFSKDNNINDNIFPTLKW